MEVALELNPAARDYPLEREFAAEIVRAMAIAAVVTAAAITVVAVFIG